MLDIIQQSFADRVTLDTLAVTIHRQAAHLGRLFRQDVGMTVRECVIRARLQEATRLIRAGVKIEAVALTVGYRSKKNFYRQFKRRFALTPEAYRQQWDRPSATVVVDGMRQRSPWHARMRERHSMIVQFIDNAAGTPVYINPAYVVSLRPDPSEPESVSIVKTRDGDEIKVRGAHVDVVDKLGRAAA